MNRRRFPSRVGESDKNRFAAFREPVIRFAYVLYSHTSEGYVPIDTYEYTSDTRLIRIRHTDYLDVFLGADRVTIRSVSLDQHSHSARSRA